MLTPIKHFPVNWVDGMKVSREHFKGLEESVFDSVRDSIALGLTDYNYGLLPSVPGSKLSLDIHNTVDQSNKIIKVKILECRAITSNGSRIEIANASKATLDVPEEELETEYNLEGSRELLFDIVVGVNLYTRTPVGLPDPDEAPPRHPHTMSTYIVKIVPSDRMNLFEFGANHLTVGKLKVVSGEVELSERYIPACSRVDAHPALLDFYYNMLQFNNDLLTNSVRIIQKINTKSEKNIVTDGIFYLSEKMAHFLSSNMDDFRLRYAQLPPIYMVSFMVRLGRLMRSAIDMRAGFGKEEMFNYFNEWTNLRAGEFETILSVLVNVEYDHTNMMMAMEKVYRFQEVVGSLYSTINTLDYIGKEKAAAPPPPPRREPVPEPEPPKPKRQGGWSHMSNSKF